MMRTFSHHEARWSAVVGAIAIGAWAYWKSWSTPGILDYPGWDRLFATLGAIIGAVVGAMMGGSIRRTRVRRLVHKHDREFGARHWLPTFARRRRP